MASGLPASPTAPGGHRSSFEAAFGTFCRLASAYGTSRLNFDAVTSGCAERRVARGNFTPGASISRHQFRPYVVSTSSWFAGHAGNSSVCVGDHKVRGNGWCAFTARVQRSSHTGALCTSRAERREPCESKRPGGNSASHSSAHLILRHALPACSNARSGWPKASLAKMSRL